MYTVKLLKTGPTENLPSLNIPALPEYWPIFKVPAEHFFAKGVSQNWPPL
jgi:hypothetical protein